MPTKIEASIQIDRPVSTVFSFYAHEHDKNHPRWDPDIKLEKITEGPIRVGTIFARENTRSGSLVKGEMKIMEFEENKIMVAVIREGGTTTPGSTTFRAEADGQTTLTIGAEFEGLDESMQTFIQSMMQRSVNNIKQLIEAET